MAKPSKPPKPPTKEHLALVDALKAKYLGIYTNRDADPTLPPTNGDSHPQREISLPTTQEIPSVAIHTTTRESVGGVLESPSMDAAETVMPSVDAAIRASLKPGDMVIEPSSISTPSRPLPTSSRELTKQDKRRGRWLAVALRVEFDPACINMTYVEKARLIGLEDLCGDDEEELVFNYTSILNDMDFVSTRKKALEAFELEMDVPTAVSIAQAAKRDPQFAIMRRRLRQMDKKHAVVGDQREQFGELMAFLQGKVDVVGAPPIQEESNEGDAGNNDEAEAGSSRLEEQDYSVSQ